MKAKLRVINQGTRYDVIGNMRKLVRKMEDGKIAPRDVVVITREPLQVNASCEVMLYHYGTGSTEDIHWMMTTAKNRVEPA
jgi:hypothetical protein